MAKLMKRKLKSGQRTLTAAADPPSDNVDEEPLNLNLIAVADSSDAEEEEEEEEEEDGDDGDDAAEEVELNRFGERDTKAGNGTASSDEDEDLDSDYLGEDESERSEDDDDDVTRDIREAIEDYVMGPEDNGREGVKEPEEKGIQASDDIANDEDDRPKIEESDSSEDEVRIFLGL
jgi:hypothetical protein